MHYDQNSVNPVNYVESNTVRFGKGPEAWQSTTSVAHQELWGAAVYGLNRGPIEKKEGTDPEPPVGVTYEKCTSADAGALMVIADGVDPVGAQINIGTVKPSVPDIEVGQYVKPVTI